MAHSDRRRGKVARSSLEVPGRIAIMEEPGGAAIGWICAGAFPTGAERKRRRQNSDAAIALA
jgi:hypothetical protein